MSDIKQQMQDKIKHGTQSRYCIVLNQQQNIQYDFPE